MYHSHRRSEGSNRQYRQLGFLGDTRGFASEESLLDGSEMSFFTCGVLPGVQAYLDHFVTITDKRSPDPPLVLTACLMLVSTQGGATGT